MNADDIVLFTEGYPLGSVTEEAFILPELGILSKTFRRVILVPIKVPPTQDERQLQRALQVGNNVEVNPCYAKKCMPHWRMVLKSFSFLGLWCRVFFQLLNQKVALRMIYIQVRQLMNLAKFSNWLKVSHINIKQSLFYSFWLTEDAEMLGLYSSMHREMIAVARAHRFDIFEMQETWLRSYGLSFLRAIYPCSKDGENALKGLYPNLTKKIAAQYLGVEKKFPNQWNPRNDTGGITFFSCHNLIPRKRGVLCAKSICQLGVRYPQKKFCWILVGDGGERQEIERIITEYSLPNLEVHFKGAMENAKVHELLSTTPIDFTILLSASEGLPVCVLESLAYGIPVVACDAGGTREAVNEETGLLLPLGITVDEVVDSVAAILTQGKKWSLLRKNARALYEEKFVSSECRERFVTRLQTLKSRVNDNV